MTIVEKIVNKDIPASIIFESKNVIAFIDNNPIKKGHLLICPKKPYANIYDLPTQILNEIMQLSQVLTKKMIDNLNLTGVSLMQNNAGLNTLNHFHLHLIPREHGDALKFDDIRIGNLTIEEQDIINSKINA